MRAGFLLAAVLILAGVAWYFFPSPGASLENPSLSRLVETGLPFPVVFTSRDNLSAIHPAPADGLENALAGKGEFKALGRLRLLTPKGKILELTWSRPLPSGNKLIDVLSPSITRDGKRVLFAGRESPPGHGRFRIYQIDVGDYSLKQLTGLPNDPGCSRVPPQRHDLIGSLLTDTQMKALDYDDIDPIELDDGTLVFSSSREPDLGIGHARRSFQIWKREKDAQAPSPMTANRNADRWPWQLSSNLVAFSMWSRNREAVSHDEKEIVSLGENTSTTPADLWMAMFLHPKGEQFGMLAKAPFDLWRPRALADGRLIFMSPGERTTTRVGVCPPGWIGVSPSARPAKGPYAMTPSAAHFFPLLDSKREPLQLAFPSPFPEDRALLAMKGSQPTFALGIASVKDVENAKVERVFDDPLLHEGEAVVVLPRWIQPAGEVRKVPMTPPPGEEKSAPVLASGLSYSAMGGLPGQTTNAGNGPAFPPPPPGLLQEIRVYSSSRDRFDDPAIPRKPGSFKFLTRLKVDKDAASGWVPSGEPTVLAAFTGEGKVARWDSQAGDLQGVKNSTYGFAGDHYSLVVPLKRTFCVGCHAGHSGLAPGDHKHQERWP